MGLVGVETTNIFTTTISLNLFSDVPDLSTLIIPADGAVDQPLQPIFTWEVAPFSSAYNFRLDLSPLFPQPDLAEGLEDSTYTPASLLQGGRCYWWSVQNQNTCGEGAWAEPFHFATASLGVTFADDIEAGDGNWTHTAAQGTDHWVISTGQSHSPTQAWFVPDDGAITNSHLWTTAPIAVGGGSQLTFWYRYQFEGSSYDGSLLEISTNGGGTWTDLGSYITTNGYNGTTNSNFSNPLGGRDGWIGDLTTWTEVTVDLSSFARQSVQIRWRIGCDSSVSDVGWYIDDVQILSPLPANPTPALLGVSPELSLAFENTPVVITGTNFITTPALMLGETWLISVTQESTTTLNAVVPAGITAGVYDLTIYNGDCQSATLEAAFTVIEGDKPIIGLTAMNDSPTELGSLTTFTATIESGTNVTYTWDFDDGSTGTGQVTTHVYADVGVYTATVTASNSNNSTEATTEVAIIAPSPVFHYIYMPVTFK